MAFIVNPSESEIDLLSAARRHVILHNVDLLRCGSYFAPSNVLLMTEARTSYHPHAFARPVGSENRSRQKG